ncbi:hypothetical protein CEW92_12715 [Bacillaceae bacterium SAS-127]|nr:hypothetical protein CEW92_12715 [Bacillaceae bacterium SAS-127]
MLAGEASLMKIIELMDELVEEIDTVMQAKNEHIAECQEIECVLEDLQHIVENIRLNAPESAKVVKKMRELREKRRELKKFIKKVHTTQTKLEPLKDDIDKTLVQIKKADQQVEAQNSVYHFRSKETAAFIDSIADHEKRSKVTMLEQQKSILIKSFSATLPNQQTETTITPSALPILQVVRKANQWLILDGEAVTFKNKKIAKIIDYIQANDLMVKMSEKNKNHFFTYMNQHSTQDDQEFTSRICSEPE